MPEIGDFEIRAPRVPEYAV